MSDSPVSSPIELIAAFESGFTGMKPADEQRVPLAQRLELFREPILARRKAGFSWKQISEVLRQPKIGLSASVVTLRRLFNDKPRTTKRPVKRITSIRVLPPGEINPAPAR